jgi:hypothetical protein
MLLAFELDNLLYSAEISLAHETVQNTNSDELFRGTPYLPPVALSTTWTHHIPEWGRVALLVVYAPTAVNGVFQNELDAGSRDIQSLPDVGVVGVSR